MRHRAVKSPRARQKAPGESFPEHRAKIDELMARIERQQQSIDRAIEASRRLGEHLDKAAELLSGHAVRQS
jgi:exonuclease VII small subunit